MIYQVMELYCGSCDREQPTEVFKTSKEDMEACLVCGKETNMTELKMRNAC